MLYPSIDELELKAGSKYTLVVAVSLRARDLRGGSHSRMKAPGSNKEVGVALEEIYHDLMIIQQNDI